MPWRSRRPTIALRPVRVKGEELMRPRTRGVHLVQAVAALVAIQFAAARAATMSYGDFGPIPPGVLFLDVSESSETDPVPLYGPPTAYPTGFDFDPSNFGASASGGADDITDGQLKFTLKSAGGNLKIGWLTFVGEGSYTLAGLDAPAPAVMVEASMRMTVRQINFVDVPPFDVVTSISPLSFSSPPNQVAQPWAFGVLADLHAALYPLYSGPDIGVTLVDVAIDSRLTASSGPGTAAFIGLREFQLGVGTIDLVPEPSQATLLGMALFSLLKRARRGGS